LQEIKSAFVLRIAPEGVDKVPEALASDQLMIGWAKAKGLLRPDMGREQFRKVLSDTYHSEERKQHKAGAAAGHVWRFLRDMEVGSLVVVPHKSDFYVARVTGPPIYDSAKAHEGSAYRRPVEWLNGKQPIARDVATAALISRMKIQGTSADASDLTNAIEEVLLLARDEVKPTLRTDLERKLVETALQEMREGRLDNDGFERLIRDVLLALGAREARVVSKRYDKGADILAKFQLAGTFERVIAVQAKRWKPDFPVGRDVVEQLIRGIEDTSANLGMVVTTGTISEDALQCAAAYLESDGVEIQLVDGAQFARLIVEMGLTRLQPQSR
jgi:predicted Mrr-cat superfamily restriction endonuclease